MFILYHSAKIAKTLNDICVLSNENKSLIKTTSLSWNGLKLT